MRRQSMNPKHSAHRGARAWGKYKLWGGGEQKISYSYVTLAHDSATYIPVVTCSTSAESE